MRVIAASALVVAIFFARPVESRTLFHHPATQYAGQVTTVASLPNVAAATFDADHQVFYTFSGGYVYKVTLAGKVSKQCRLGINTAGGLTYDSTNQTIYATNPQGYSIWSLSLTCKSALLAGGTYGTQDGQGSSAQFQNPTGITLDVAHQVMYVADVDRLRAVTVGGLVTTFTPPGSIGQVGFFGYQPWPIGLAFDAAHNLIDVADPTREMVESVNARGRVLWIAGRCAAQQYPQCSLMQVDGSRNRAGFGSPAGVAINPADGSLYVVEGDNEDVRHIAGNAVSTLAGSGIIGNTDGAGLSASFYGPQALAIDPVSGTLLVIDGGNQLLRLVTTQGAAPPPPPHGTISYDPPSYLSGPNSIAVAADGTVWFAEGANARIGRRTTDGHMHEFVLPRLRVQPANLLIGPDGAVWFTDAGLYRGTSAAVARLASNGVITEYSVGTGIPYQNPTINQLTVGSDGNVWFTDSTDGVFGYVTMAGTVTQFPVGFAFIAAGFDGDIWTAQQNGVSPVAVYRYTTGGQLVQAYNVVSGFGGFVSFANGPNQAIWYVFQPGVETIQYVTLDGKVKSYFPPGKGRCLSYASALTPGPDGNEWYSWGEGGCNLPVSGELASITPAGQSTLYPIYEARPGPSFLTFAPDGTLWFADPSANKIGKMY